MPRGYALSDEMADQLVKMLAWWTAQPQGSTPGRIPLPNKTTTNIQRLRITDAVPTTESSIDYYEADVIRWNITSGIWEVVADASPVQVFDPAGGSFAVDDETDARMVGSGDIGGDTYPVFEKMAGGGTSVKMFRATYFFVQDDPPDSPLCYYPVIEVTCTAAGGFADATLVAWWVTPYTYAIFDPLAVAGAPYTVIKADGTAYVTGIPAGFDYAPQNNGTPAHPNNGESRPVYMDARYAAGWAIGCDPITGLPTMTLGDG